jgi:ElaB/YqjD/DUF883 family membrane-anchored ribosome-binding protein
MSEMTPDQTTTPIKPISVPTMGNDDSEPGAKVRFAKALEEAKAGAHQLGKEAQERVGAYKEKVAGTSGDLLGEAKTIGAQAKDQAFILANEGKAKASEAISGLGKLVEENAATIDEKVGVKYGDYARSAARGMQDAATKLETKELGELGEEAKEFVRKSPGIAVGIAAAVGFVISRMFRKSGR